MVVGESGLSTSSPVGAGTRGNGRLGGGWERGGKVEKEGGKGVGKGGKGEKRWAVKRMVLFLNIRSLWERGKGWGTLLKWNRQF